MRKVLFGLLAALFVGSFAHAQTAPVVAKVASGCGTPPFTYSAGQNNPVLQDTNGYLCQNSSGGTQPAPLAVTPTDKGGTITVGGTSQTAIAANTSRKGCWIQNPVNATEDLYVSSTAAAVTTAGTPDDADLGPGGSWSCVQGGVVIQTAIRVNAVTATHAFIAKESQ